MWVLGLMSGTSADGVDAVLVRLGGSSRRPRWRVSHTASIPYPDDLRRRIIGCGQGQPMAAAALLDMMEALTDIQAEAARACDPTGRAELVGCHGQTLWHRPPVPGRRGASWQALQAPLLAERLQRPVVFDFRAADLALGGQGAPLVPATDAALLGGVAGWRAVLNLGGIANVTLLPPRQGPDRHQPVRGWDCGPANTLIDLAVHQFSEGRLSFDAAGEWARQGCVDEAVIALWLQEPYLRQPPPKSTGREAYGAEDLRWRLDVLRERSPGLTAADALATLTAFSAAAVARDLRRGTPPVEVLVAGGGTRNLFLLDQLRQRCQGMVVRPLAEIGIGAMEREALAFALLAWWHVRGHPGSLPSVTGARGQAVLGVRANPPWQSRRFSVRGGARGAGVGEPP
ncbi:MAG: anhydro-N-acetylmuramic acid kinase [Cyanobacteria bacterium K_Offshore_surface_m2_239]|nr:anhydro-N-acetylmuramic acid kinase [Cyanobacteria bacterium K_Offshore_surface_m2_239]